MTLPAFSAWLKGCCCSFQRFFTKLPIHSVMAKSDLEYSLHLAVRGVPESSFSLITKKVAAPLPQRKFGGRKAKVVLPTVWHPYLTDTLIGVALLAQRFWGWTIQIFSMTLAIGQYTVREYESKVVMPSWAPRVN